MDVKSKMKASKLFFILGIGMLLASCAGADYVTHYRYDENTARYTIPNERPTYITPTIADLEISSQKVMESESYKNTLTAEDFENLNKGATPPTIDYLKNLTVSKVVKKYNADVIVAPIFDVKTTDDFESVIVTVSGYPATYKNFRVITPDDAEYLRVYGVEINTPAVLVK